MQSVSSRVYLCLMVRILFYFTYSLRGKSVSSHSRAPYRNQPRLPCAGLSSPCLVNFTGVEVYGLNSSGSETDVVTNLRVE